MTNIYEFSLFVKGGAGSILSANEMACFLFVFGNNSEFDANMRWIP
jgi:hypothetical protein